VSSSSSPANVRAFLTRPRLFLALAALAAFLLLRLLFAFTTHDLAVARVTASGTFGTDNRYAPEKVADRSTIEAASLQNYWLLPNKTPGWIRLELDREYLLEEVALLNTRNGLGSDRRTRSYHLELVGPGSLAPISSVLPPYPKWQRQRTSAIASAVVVHVDEFDGLGGGLDEVSLVGRPAHGLGSHRDSLLALLVTIALLLAWVRSPPRIRALLTRERLLLGAMILALAVIGQRLLRFSTSVSVFEWGLAFQASEFDTLAKIQAFFWGLRIPLPPVLAFLEIVSYRLTGSSDFVIKTLYKVSIVGGYVGALLLAYPRLSRMIPTFLVSLVFLASTVAIHPGNPQVYDAVFPFLAVTFLVCLSGALRAAPAGRARLALLVLAGLTLSIFGLTRPFAVFLVPLVAFLVARRLGLRPRRELVAFLVSAAVLVLPWHLQLLARHGQITMSNHTGFNLRNAWPMVRMPELIPEDRTLPNRWFNNPQHIVNSRRVQGAVLGYIAGHPWIAFKNVARRLDAMIDARTVVMPSRHVPDDDVLLLYQPLLRLLFLLALLSGGRRVLRWVRDLPGRLRRKKNPARGGDTVGACLLVLALGSLGLLAVGDAGEEARFVISLLPMLAVVPFVRVEHDLESDGLAARLHGQDQLVDLPARSAAVVGEALGDVPRRVAGAQ
jgi:hypothetical protein